MSFNVQDLVFSLEVKKEEGTTPQAALKLADNEGLALEKAFICGRTSGDPGTVLMRGESAYNDLKRALREMLDKLEEMTPPPAE